MKTIRASMPQDAPDTLGTPAYVDLVSYLFKANGGPAGADGALAGFGGTEADSNHESKVTARRGGSSDPPVAEGTCVRRSSRRRSSSSLGVSAVTAARSGASAAPAAAGGRGNFANNFTGKITLGDTNGDAHVAHPLRSRRADDLAHPRHAADAACRRRTRPLPGAGQRGARAAARTAGADETERAALARRRAGQAAVQFSVFSGKLEWKHPVTDDEYLGKK